jgi:hypothetical protein
VEAFVAEVYAHVESIPDELKACIADKHAWVAYDWHGFNANNHSVRKPENAVYIDITQRCARCDQLRHTTMTMGRRGPVDRTKWAYTQRNEALASPRGVRQTGISIRHELSLGALWDEVREAPIPLRSAKSKSARRGAA